MGKSRRAKIKLPKRPSEKNAKHMAEAAILSVIENLEYWLHKKVDIWEDNYKKLRSLLLAKDSLPDHFRIDNKEKLYNSLVGMGKRKNKKDLHTLLVEMVDYWELGNKGKLYSLLVWVAEPDLYSKKGKFSKEKPHNFLVEMADLWEDDKGKLIDNGKLQRLLVEVADSWKENKRKFYGRKVYGLLVEVLGFWKDNKLKLNKEKLYSWLARKVDLWEDKLQLLRLVLDVALRQEDNNPHDRPIFTTEIVELLITTLRMILDFLKDVQQIGEGSTLHYYICDAVEMAQDAQILVEVKDSDPFILILEIFNRKDHGSIHQDSEGLHDKVMFILNETDNIRRCILQIGEDIDMPPENEGDPEGDHDDIVGLEEDIKLLLRIRNEEIGTTTFIRGMGGIGKTALALALYNHAYVKNQFAYRAWLCLSREMSRREILMKIIRKVVDRKELEKDASFDEMDRVDNKSLKQMLHKYLQGKPYFIVLDDVLEKKYSHYVFEALPKDKGSRLLFTTRSVDIKCNSLEDYNHKMNLLDDYNSWKLLLKTTLSGELEFPKDLEKRGKQMLKKCNGLPLAIKEVGKHWAENLQSGSKWEEVLESMDLGTTLEKLESTYNEMLPQMKSFFLQLSFYKEGTTIRANKLVQIWTTGGVISPEEEFNKTHLSKSSDDEEEENGKYLDSDLDDNDDERDDDVDDDDLEEEEGEGDGDDDGEDEDEEGESRKCIDSNLDDDDSEEEDNFGYYLSELSKRSIIEAHDMNKRNNEIKTFRVNVVFHRVSIEEAKKKIRFEIQTNDGNDQPPIEPRHRVIYCTREKIDYSTYQDKHLVSLIFHGGGYFYYSPSQWKQFEKLKILDMEDFGLRILPDGIEELTELRYLGLRNNYLQELPHSLGNLKNLEVLDIALNFMVEMPDIIWEMDSLCHLYMSDISFWKPLKIDILKNLKTLSYISVDSFTYEFSGLELMTSLRKLGIEEVDENSNLQKLFVSLVDLKKLDCLILRGFRFRSMPSLDKLGLLDNICELKLEGRLTRLPSAKNFPRHIEFLTLVNSSLDEDPMPILENLCNLEYLKLQNAYIGQQMVISHHGFPNLIHLVIEVFWQLRNIEVQENAMQNLQRLEIINCPYLEIHPKIIRRKCRWVELKNKSKKEASKFKESHHKIESLLSSIYAYKERIRVNNEKIQANNERIQALESKFQAKAQMSSDPKESC